MERHHLYPRQSDNSMDQGGIWGPRRLHTGIGLWAVAWLKGGCVDEEGTAAKTLLRMAYTESSRISVWVEPEVDRTWPDSPASHGLGSGL